MHKIKQIKVEVAYALPQQQWIKEITLPAGSTIEDAIHQSGIETVLSGPLDQYKVGRFGVQCGAHLLVNEGDRIEIYRPLIIDPKEARRAKAKRMKR